jgi:hypothetical protein
MLPAPDPEFPGGIRLNALLAPLSAGSEVVQPFFITRRPDSTAHPATSGLEKWRQGHCSLVATN